MCLDESKCYTFAIEDTYGDGLSTEGDFSLLVSGVEILSDPGINWSDLRVQFGSGCVPTTSPVTATLPTQAPVLVVECLTDELDVLISVKTDMYPTEISWVIENDETGNIIYEDGPFEEQEYIYTDRFCLDSSECYSFKIIDTYGDGIMQEGNFGVFVDGDLVLSDTDFDWNEMDVSFGSCGRITPTQSPTQPPTQPPTQSPTTLEIETQSPSTSLTTLSPTKNQTPPPSPAFKTPSPISSPSGPSDCTDSLLRFRFDWNNGKISRSCAWVANKDTLMRCNAEGVSSMCPAICNTCNTCVDSSLRFRFDWNNGKISRSCTWVANKDTLIRCNAEGVAESCRATCGLC